LFWHRADRVGVKGARYPEEPQFAGGSHSLLVFVFAEKQPGNVQGDKDAAPGIRVDSKKFSMLND
jgi:hypothetical protein